MADYDAWYTEPLATKITPLIASDTPPKTCDEFIHSIRMSSAFSLLQEAPDLAGMTMEQAIQEDRALNSKRFGVDDPKRLMQELSRQFEAGRKVDPEVLKKSAVVLETVKNDSLELAGQQQDGSPTQTAYFQDAEAAKQASGIIAELASELGISLPITRATVPDCWNATSKAMTFGVRRAAAVATPSRNAR